MNSLSNIALPLGAKTLRVAVIGIGRIGWEFHCHQLAQLDHYQLVAVCDTSAAYRDEATQKYGVMGYESASQMLLEEQLDVIVIAIPTHLHHQVALLALSHNCHVVVEKPVALNLLQTQEIFDEAKRRGLCATVYQPYRCTTAHLRLIDAIRDGELGDIHLVRRIAHSFTRRADWQALRKYGGGSLMNTGAHFIDQAVALWGRDLCLIAVRTRQIFALGDAEDYVHLTLESAGGVLIELEINPASLDISTIPSFAIYGSAGNFFQQGELNRLLRINPASLAERHINDTLRADGRSYQAEKPDIITEQFVEPVWTNDNRYFYENFYDAVINNGSLITPPEDTLAVMTLLEQAQAK